MQIFGNSVAWLCLVLTLVAIGTASADDVDRPGTGQWCYDPVHTPSNAEKAAFIANISGYAVAAEKKWGIPAPVLAAQAIDESGYGLTRLAIKSNNIFAFKWPGTALAQGNSPFTLWCQPPPDQPPYDKGNIYIAFASQAAAADFVAGRLKLSKYYVAATQAYQNDLHAGVDRQMAALRWLTAVAPSYNKCPADYVQAIEKIINNPMQPGGTPLWSLSP